MTGALYGEDLASIHHGGFGGFAAAAAPGLLGMLRDAGIHDGLVVDLGCGSGIWARALTDAGYGALGIDVSGPMLAIAREVAPDARFTEGSLWDAEIPRCAAVTAMGEAVGYLPPGEDELDVAGLAARVHAALHPGGVFVLDLVMRDARVPMRYRGGREGPGWRLEVEVEEAPERWLLTRRIRIHRDIDGRRRTTEETHRVRTFARGDVEAILRGADFTVRVHRRYGAAPLPPHRLGFRARSRR